VPIFPIFPTPLAVQAQEISMKQQRVVAKLASASLVLLSGCASLSPPTEKLATLPVVNLGEQPPAGEFILRLPRQTHSKPCGGERQRPDGSRGAHTQHQPASGCLHPPELGQRGRKKLADSRQGFRHSPQTPAALGRLPPTTRIGVAAGSEGRLNRLPRVVNLRFLAREPRRVQLLFTLVMAE